MEFLEIRTILVITVLTMALGTVVVARLWYQNRRRFAGVGLWVFNFGFQFLAFLLISLRGNIPDFLSIVVSNTLSVTGFVLSLIGLQKFLNVKASNIHNYILIVCFTAIHSWFTFYDNCLEIRHLNSAVFDLIFSLHILWLIYVKARANLDLTRGLGFV